MRLLATTGPSFRGPLRILIFRKHLRIGSALFITLSIELSQATLQLMLFQRPTSLRVSHQSFRAEPLMFASENGCEEGSQRKRKGATRDLSYMTARVKKACRDIAKPSTGRCWCRIRGHWLLVLSTEAGTERGLEIHPCDFECGRLRAVVLLENIWDTALQPFRTDRIEMGGTQKGSSHVDPAPNRGNCRFKFCAWIRCTGYDFCAAQGT